MRIISKKAKTAMIVFCSVFSISCLSTYADEDAGKLLSQAIEKQKEKGNVKAELDLSLDGILDMPDYYSNDRMQSPFSMSFSANIDTDSERQLSHINCVADMSNDLSSGTTISEWYLYNRNDIYYQIFTRSYSNIGYSEWSASKLYTSGSAYPLNPAEISYELIEPKKWELSEKDGEQIISADTDAKTIIGKFIDVNESLFISDMTDQIGVHIENIIDPEDGELSKTNLFFYGTDADAFDQFGQFIMNGFVGANEARLDLTTACLKTSYQYGDSTDIRIPIDCISALKNDE